MSTKRLSRLQKWILVEAAKAPGGYYHRNEIMARFYGLVRPTHFGRYMRRSDAEQRKARAASVAIARSLAGLSRKSLIKVRWASKIIKEENLTKEKCRVYQISSYSYMDIVTLTDAGNEIARGLNVNPAATAAKPTIRPSLNVNSGTNGAGVNNKRKAKRRNA